MKQSTRNSIGVGYALANVSHHNPQKKLCVCLFPHLTHHSYSYVILTIPVPISISITFSYVCLNIDSILYVTSVGEIPKSPSISFAHIPILIFSMTTKLWMFGDRLSNFILLLSYHNEHMQHPNIIPHNFR